MGYILLEIDEDKLKSSKTLENMAEDLEKIAAVEKTAVVELGGSASMEVEDVLILGSDVEEMRDRIFQMEGDDPLHPLRELRDQLDLLLCSDASRLQPKLSPQGWGTMLLLHLAGGAQRQQVMEDAADLASMASGVQDVEIV